MPWWAWLTCGILLLLIETRAPRDFTLFSVGISAVLVGLAALLGVFNLWAQWASFAVLSGATLFWVRDYLRDAFVHKHGGRDFSNVVGEIAYPIDDLQPFGFGRAELRGSTWSAHNASSVSVARGRRCRVMEVKGLTLWILPE